MANLRCNIEGVAGQIQRGGKPGGAVPGRWLTAPAEAMIDCKSLFLGGLNPCGSLRPPLAYSKGSRERTPIRQCGNLTHIFVEMGRCVHFTHPDGGGCLQGGLRRQTDRIHKRNRIAGIC